MITSPSNEYIKFVRSLKQRKYRDESKRFYIEGGKLIWEALDCGATIERLLFCPELLRSPAEKGIVNRAEGLGIGCAEVDRKVFERISDWDDPDGLGAVVVMRLSELSDVHTSGVPLIVLLDSVQDPGNLGTTIRTAEAAGASAVILVGPCVDLHNPKTIRATMGSFFGIPVINCGDDSTALDWLQTEGIRVVAGEPGAQSAYCEESYLGPTCFVVGNEAHGIRGAILHSSDTSVRIPIAGKADSLNAAVSSAILLYEAIRQRSGGARAPVAAGASSPVGSRNVPPARRHSANRSEEARVGSRGERSRPEGRHGSVAPVPPARSAGFRETDMTVLPQREEAGRTPGEKAGGSRRKEEARPQRKETARPERREEAGRPPGNKADRPPWNDARRPRRKGAAQPPEENDRRPQRKETARPERREDAGRPPGNKADRPPWNDARRPRRKGAAHPPEENAGRPRRQEHAPVRKQRTRDATTRRSTRREGDRD